MCIPAHRAAVLTLVLGLGAGLPLAVAPARAAEQVVFVSGAFRRSIPVADLEHLARTGEARGLLADVLRFGRQKPADVAKLLNREISLPLVLTSRLLGTRIGVVALERVARILHPLRAPAVGVPALRAATILGLEAGNGRLSPVGFLRAYPNEDLAVSLPALRIALNRVNAMSELVRTFLETDLGSNLEGGGPAAP
jgi:hypothetical protein